MQVGTEEDCTTKSVSSFQLTRSADLLGFALLIQNLVTFHCNLKYHFSYLEWKFLSAPSSWRMFMLTIYNLEYINALPGTCADSAFSPKLLKETFVPDLYGSYCQFHSLFLSVYGKGGCLSFTFPVRNHVFYIPMGNTYNVQQFQLKCVRIFVKENIEVLFKENSVYLSIYLHMYVYIHNASIYLFLSIDQLCNQW